MSVYQGINTKHYYSFGGEMPGRIYSSGYRYNYQGQEDAVNSNWQAFELRMHNSDLGRWFAPDPYGQFFSPYVSMGNNPVSGVDPDGGWANNYSQGMINSMGKNYGNMMDVLHGYNSSKQFYEGELRGMGEIEWMKMRSYVSWEAKYYNSIYGSYDNYKGGGLAFGGTDIFRMGYNAYKDYQQIAGTTYMAQGQKKFEELVSNGGYVDGDGHRWIENGKGEIGYWEGANVMHWYDDGTVGNHNSNTYTTYNPKFHFHKLGEGKMFKSSNGSQVPPFGNSYYSNINQGGNNISPAGYGTNEHLIGPTLIALGANIMEARGKFKGATKGTSIASKTLSKVIPQKFTNVLGQKAGTKVATTIGTNVVGRFLGRLVPYVGWVITTYDIISSCNEYVVHGLEEQGISTEYYGGGGP